MADQKRWFKVWTSIVANAHFAEMSLEDIGRWTLLGASTALDGDKGRLPVPGTGKELCRILRVSTIEQAIDTLKRLKSVAFEQAEKRDGEHTVTWKNWRKYQEDSTSAERMKTLRSKKRGEEKRITPIAPSSTSNGFDRFWSAYPRRKSKGQARKAWLALKPSEQLQDRILKAVERAKTSAEWVKDGGQFVPYPATWLRAEGWEDQGSVAGPSAALREMRRCAACGGSHPWQKGQRLEPCPQEPT